MRNVFLKTVELTKAMEMVTSLTPLKPAVECLPLIDCLHRVTAEPLFAQLSNPNYNAAAMDGIMVIADHTIGASETQPLELKRGVDFEWVNTGHVIRPPYNAVIMVEDVEVIGDVGGDADVDGSESLVIRQSAHPWQHVRVVGEDIAIGDMIMSSGRRIGPMEMGALASAGVLEVPVVKALKVAIIPTGSEMVNSPLQMAPGAIMESNSYMFKGLIEEAGHHALVFPVVRDVKHLLAEAVAEACEVADIVVINAGSSAGSEDYTRTVLAELGAVHFHGIDIKPGKPTIFASVNDKPVFGIPGYPVSAFVAFDALVMPLLAHKTTECFEAVLTKPLVSSLKHEEFVRVQVAKIEDRFVATPVSRGAGATMSLVKANAMLRIPRLVEGYPAGEVVQVSALHHKRPFESALLAIGSHDLVMDVLEDLAPEPFTILSSHVGSLGGLLALKRRECHIAPTHLLEEDGKGYNRQYVRRYFSDEPMVLVKGIVRHQGLYLRKDTCAKLVEKGVLKPADAEGFSYINTGSLGNLLEGHTFVNRQKGSGTRVLFDALLKGEQLEAQGIEGYHLEVLTHTAVALAVQNGTADLGMGIAAAAERMHLCFVPIAKEDYDFLARPSLFETPLGVSFLSLLNSHAFGETLSRFKGYDLEPIVLQEVTSESQ